ncbi:hypothetical protein [Chengkuizengella axinellae]|uniref:Uncharacterized protein n=1 Tax=Chengkuizengella axinellae TaxID=3064388 RepID=A0ABT9IXD9_9BACL|nr:hypothetical protein [Chengkuizengella sp. 2205SS18-9]MDP5273995.1 hypothetical protein [Chengkuizengella sp. 2205SS18-9]
MNNKYEINEEVIKPIQGSIRRAHEITEYAKQKKWTAQELKAAIVILSTFKF